MLQGATHRRERPGVSLLLGQESPRRPGGQEPGPRAQEARRPGGHDSPPFPTHRMSGYDTPPGGQSSWVDMGCVTPPVPPSPGRATPVGSQDQDYLRMLREAQKEFSARSSHRVSPITSAMMSVSSTTRNTPSSSPKSPPNSPNVELGDFREFKEQLKLQGVFINREPEHSRGSDYPGCEWRSRPTLPTAAARARQGRRVEVAREGDSRLLLALLASNAISLGLGVAVGYWLYRKSTSGSLLA